MGPRAATAVIERSVWEMQSTTRALVAHAGWVHETTLELGSVMLTGSGVLGTGGQQVKEKLFGWEGQHTNARSRQATAKRWFPSAKR